MTLTLGHMGLYQKGGIPRLQTHSLASKYSHERSWRLDISIIRYIYIYIHTYIFKDIWGMTPDKPPGYASLCIPGTV